jgi:phospholipase/lecithinase/hemolysin
VEWAEALAPTTVFVWLGNNDALRPATNGDASLLTPLTDFQAAYAEVMSRLSATGATLVVANIPDIASIPFLTSAEKVAESVGVPLSIIGPALGIGPGDFVIPDAFPHIAAILHGLEPGPLAANLVLDAGEVATIRAAVSNYNAFIAAQASAHGAALVDIHALVDELRDKGLVAGGQRLTIDFLGGLFSLDGIHPTNTGYALIANKFIHALNTQFAAGIPAVSLEQIKKSDPLVLAGVGHPASALGHVSAETAASVRNVIGRRK